MPKFGAEFISEIMEDKGYKVFRDSRGYDLNIVGIRTPDMTANTFNDWICIFYLFEGRWNFFAFPATTDPGTFWRENPMNVKGTAILKPGQYRGMWKLGKHKGSNAFVQAKPCTVYRDNDCDNVLDTESVDEESGLFGINGHRSNSGRASTQVDKWSAGCQVWQDPIQHDFAYNMGKTSSEIYGNSFTYTLLMEDDLKRK